MRSVLQRFGLIYVRGGNVFILRRALKQSGADEIIKDLLHQDSVAYAGYSAGPIMLGPTLRGIETMEDDPDVVPEGYEPDVIWDCLKVLPYAIVPHHHSDWPGIHESMQKTIRYFIQHHIPFIALRDGEAIIIDGDLQVIVG